MRPASGSIAGWTVADRVGQQRRRGAVRDHADALRRHQLGVDHHPPGGLGEDRDQRGAVAQRAQHLRLPGGRLGQHRVQRHDERLGQLLDQREHEGAGDAAEDAVLVLDQDDVGAPGRQRPRDRRVVAADVLPDAGDDLGGVLAVLLPGQRDHVDLGRGVGLQQRRTQVRCEGPDAARARRVGGHDRDAHWSALPCSGGAYRSRPAATTTGQTGYRRAVQSAGPRRWRAPRARCPRHSGRSAGRRGRTPSSVGVPGPDVGTPRP